MKNYLSTTQPEGVKIFNQLLFSGSVFFFNVFNIQVDRWSEVDCHLQCRGFSSDHLKA